METTQLPSKWQAPFFTIWTGQLFSLLGSAVAQFALVWWLTQLTGSATVLATATLVALIPQIVLGPLAGAYVDRWSRRAVMIVADSFIALVSLWLVYLFWSGRMQVWHVYVVMVARALGGIFHWPAMSASTSLMVPKEHLARVAGLNQTVHGAMNIIGPPLGALSLALLPLHGVMLIDVGTAAIAVSPLFFVRIPQPRRAAPGSRAVKPSVWTDLWEGLRYVKGWPGMMLLLGMAMILNFVLAPAGTLSPLLIVEHFRGGAPQLGWFNSAWGLGVVVGGLVLSAWGGFRRRMATSLMGVALMGLGCIWIGLTPAAAFWLVVAGSFVVGLTNSLANGPITAIFQAIVAPGMQGRLFTVTGSLCTAMMPLSLAVAGPLADRVGVQSWYVAGGILCTLMGVVGFFVPALIDIDRGRETGGQPASSASCDELPAPLMTSEPGSFARSTIVERKPQIIRQVLADNGYPPEVVQALEDFRAEISARPVCPLAEQAADVPFWNQELAAYAGKTWLEIPWYFAETFFYRRLLEAVCYFQPGHWRGCDPFEKQKREQERVAVERLAEGWGQLAAAGPAEAFEALLHSCLWGNRADLSNYTVEVQARGGLAAREERRYLLIDHTEAVREVLSRGAARVDFICDNVGLDLLFDLALADFLLARGWTRRVAFHLKERPFFVSDAMPKDVWATVASVQAAPDAMVRELGARLYDHLQAERLVLKDDPFWATCLMFHHLPLALQEDLALSNLVILKGDVNYRRLLDDRHWPHAACLEEIAAYFPAPFLVLRTLKSEIVAGLEPGRAEALAAEDSTWLIDGKWGIVQLVQRGRVV